jgi:hypothetical protein
LDDDKSTVVWTGVGVALGVVLIAAAALIVIRFVLKRRSGSLQDQSPDTMPGMCEYEDPTSATGTYMNPVSQTTEPEFFVVTQGFTVVPE